MTDPAAIIERVLEEHEPIGSSGWRAEDRPGWGIGCRCGSRSNGYPTWPAAESAHRAHVAAEIVKALGLHEETRRLDDGMASWATRIGGGPSAPFMRPQTTQTRHVTPWSSQEPRQRPRTAGGHTETGQRETAA